MNTYRIEITDTFAGEANYCWVRRYSYRARSIRNAITKMAREHGAGWRLDYGDNMFARYNLQGAASVRSWN